MDNNETEAIATKMDTHFSNVAEIYRTLRNTDVEPILKIKSTIKKNGKISIIDIGCGTGRYDELLFENFEPDLHLTCVDKSPEMLNELATNLLLKNYSQFETIVSDGEQLTFEDNSFDFVVSFNAIHHFNLFQVLKEMARITNIGGHIFIYTRSPIQNANSIWGRQFPQFCDKEDRLFSVSDFELACSRLEELSLSSVLYFYYKREASLPEMIEYATSHHYSTFSLYDQDEFSESLSKFIENIKSDHKSVAKVNWIDGNILYIIKKTPI